MRDEMAVHNPRLGYRMSPVLAPRNRRHRARSSVWSALIHLTEIIRNLSETAFWLLLGYIGLRVLKIFLNA